MHIAWIGASPLVIVAFCCLPPLLYTVYVALHDRRRMRAGRSERT